ncbi:dihydrofolate reductase family protein [Paucibacter sp. PLA-PC-4]|uniref:dihydrofolate reductase family protein n=1 Tax=Paucibacter sp. PLA-PC-4 TaxID=2993655 RepID=UPI0022498F77|nr:dihydrofolate reductase family protein [Paucibacter sp. PLA-PC-4]MCX2862323.1 dihydrofolate reductase family protein [Paucibacter sp. PLA-PC-4]
MGKLIISTMCSLDGYCAGPGGLLDDLPMDAAFDAHNLELMRHAGTQLFGATTFALFRDFWPLIGEPCAREYVVDPAGGASRSGEWSGERLENPPDPELSPSVREIARLIAPMGKLVVSDRLAPADTKPWQEAEIVRRAEAHARIQAVKASAARDLLIYGSPLLASDLLAEGLVDELNLLIGPVVLGAGLPALRKGLPAPLRLLDARRPDDSDTMRLRYTCTPARRGWA